MRWAKFIEATEDVLLDLQVFKDGFDHEVCLTCRIFQGLDRPDPLPCSVGLLLAEPPFGDAVLKQCPVARNCAFQKGFVYVGQVHLIAVQGELLGNL